MPVCDVCGTTYEGDHCPQCAKTASETTTTFTPVGGGETAHGEFPHAAGVLSLTVVKGPQMGDSFDIAQALTTIGRDPEADIFLNDRTVSRHHAEIVVSDDSTVLLRDKNSLNGTYLDGTLVDEAELLSGSIIQIGTFQLQFIQG